MPDRRIIPPDQDQRDIILHELDTTLLVEAAAGTGKTTGMVGRMVNMLAEGTCTVDTLAAVTFTRKAAAELRSRFQIELEKAGPSAGAVSQKRLRKALEGMERCFIGTIHSFCARMLRERPVEAGVDLDFEEVEEVEDLALRNQAWTTYLKRLYASDDPILNELEELGVEIGQLDATFVKIADYPDVDEWPAAAVPAPDVTQARDALAELIRHMEDVEADLPESTGTDPLMPKYRMIPRMFRQIRRRGRAFELMEILAEFKQVRPVKKYWPRGAEQANAELALWDDFRTRYAEPLVKQWKEHRYEPLLRAILPAVEIYDRLRADTGKLNYQDLLMKAAGLLRNATSSRVRDYFRHRFTHILVDEFQDTDPVQAEVIMLLTADNPKETNWRKCRPVPGSLFVVGDPKQSIYRFRRADIVTYDQVKQQILRHGGKVVTLTANFRTTRPIVDWVNAAFQEEFQRYAAECSPQYVPLTAVRDDDNAKDLTGVSAIRVPRDCTNNDLIGEYEGELIARTIRHAIDTGFKIPRTVSELAAGIGPEVRPGDFLIVTRNKRRLHVYSRKLQELAIPHQVTGGRALNRVEELSLLYTCLTAVTQPENPVALVAVLRGDLFGISDPDLFAFRRAGGHFSYTSPMPQELDPGIAEQFIDAFEHLKRYAVWLTRFPAISAFERIAADLGLWARAAVSSCGDVQAGGFAKGLELIRAAQRDSWSMADLVSYLGKIVAEDEVYDAVPARPQEASVVRVMNLHKVKGLEAPVVFLADPTGRTQYPAELYVDRASETVRGYLAVTGTFTGMRRKVDLAHPPGWEHYSATEDEFQRAEELRLLYVAATRAGCGLVISLRATYGNRNPWDFFKQALKPMPTLENPGPQQAAFADGAALTEQDAADAFREIEQGWQELAKKTYDVAAVKATTVARGQFTYSLGEHGTEWGTVIHLLLEAAMEDESVDIRALAEAAVGEQGLDPSLAEEAVETVTSVLHSEFWKRAKGSQERLVEVPFQRLKPGEPDTGAPDTVLRGAIDLAFKESGGWVIVDYKSDRIPEARLDELVRHYSPQVVSYAEAWSEITGLPVIEAGLYFTHLRAYRICGT